MGTTKESIATISAIKKLFRLCPICNNPQGSVLHRQTFSLPSDYRLPDAYDVVECSNCGFVYADTSASQDDYDHYYKVLSKYEDETTGSGSGNKPYDAERLMRVASDIEKLLTNKASSVLDAGCGNGGLLLALKRLGFTNITGLDPAEKSVCIVKNLSIHAVQGNIFSTRFQSQFDCIILSHVLEHIYDLQTAIRNITSWIKPGGYLYIEVPDASRYCDYFIVPYYYFDVEHINHFDELHMDYLMISQTYECIFSSKKEITISPSTAYPAFYSIYKKIRNDSISPRLTFNNNLGESIRKFIAMSSHHKKWEELHTLVANQEKIIVWGAGSYTQRLLENSELGQCNISAFVDNDPKKQGQTLHNIKILSPAALQSHSGPIVICSALFSDEIMNQIEKMNIRNPIIVLK